MVSRFRCGCRPSWNLANKKVIKFGLERELADSGPSQLQLNGVPRGSSPNQEVTKYLFF